jgi:hypothetical protein
MLFQITSQGDEGIACVQLLLIVNISIRHCNLTPLELQPARQYLRRYGCLRYDVVDGSQTCSSYNVFYGSDAYWYTIQ